MRVDGNYVLPPAVVHKAERSTRVGGKIRVTPREVVDKILSMDKALNGTSNDDEHDELLAIREWLSDILEDPDRRITP